MIPARVPRAVPLLLFGAMLALAVVQLLAFWPGIMVWDAIRQYGQALSGRYDDWHPPAMNWLWRQLGLFGGGPAPMLALQALLYWSGFALLAWAALRRGRTVLACAIGACTLLPIPFFLIGSVLKDSLMAGALLLASGLIAIRRPDDRMLAALTALLLIAAATLRFNAVPACLPLMLALLPAGWRRSKPRLALAALIAAVPLAIALPVANHMLKAERSGVELSLPIFDLGGITYFAGADALPPLAAADPVAINARCYKPVSWDVYAWWGPTPCPIGFTDMRASFAAHHLSPVGWWLGQIARHPLAYAEHRLAHSNQNLRFLVHDADLPTLTTQTDNNPWNFAVPPSGLRDAITSISKWALETPLGWPICWLALGIGVLMLAPSFEAGDPALPLAWSAVLYALSYVPLSVASEVRYHVWTISAVALAAVMAADRIAIIGIRPRRLALALAPCGIVTATAEIYRLAF